MDWLSGLSANVTRNNMNESASKADDDVEAAASSVGGIGGAIAGITVGAIFGPVGMAIGACAGSKIGAEGLQAGVRRVKDFLDS